MGTSGIFANQAVRLSMASEWWAGVGKRCILAGKPRDLHGFRAQLRNSILGLGDASALGGEGWEGASRLQRFLQLLESQGPNHGSREGPAKKGPGSKALNTLRLRIQLSQGPSTQDGTSGPASSQEPALPQSKYACSLDVVLQLEDPSLSAALCEPKP